MSQTLLLEYALPSHRALPQRVQAAIVRFVR
jgi:hypothetical protein